jgi:3-oxoacyl-[acyl-carrier protein] reductase
MADVTFDFSDKTVVVCGGSRGIGRAIALAFAAAGAHVSVCARGVPGVEAVTADLIAAGGRGHGAVCDLADGAAIEAYIASAAGLLAGIDVLVNNASGFGMADDEAGWAAALGVDIQATARATRFALPHMRGRAGASVINITSISGYRASARGPAYAAVKAALVNLTMSQALMLAKDGVRVNAIAPGSIEFPGGTWEKRRTEDPDLFARVLRSIPFSRLGTPEEMASVALFLASPAAAWVTGHTIVADGGQLLTS